MRTPTPGPRARVLDVVVLALVAVLLLVAGIGIDRVTRDGASAAAPALVPTTFDPPGPPADIRDDFHRPDSRTLGTAATGQRWERVGGAWGVRDATATLLQAAVGRPSLVVVDLGSTDGSVTVTAVAVAPGSGLVVRASGPADYWMVFVDPFTRRWAVARVEPGRRASLQYVATERARAGDVVQVRMAPDALATSINGGDPVSTDDAGPHRGTRIGFVGIVPDTDAVRWGDLSATADPAGAPPPSSSRSTTTSSPPATGFGP